MSEILNFKEEYEKVLTELLEKCKISNLLDKIKKNLNIIKLNFKKSIKGYHIVNKTPIKEAPWEEINSQILNKSKIYINYCANGSHISGCDLKTNFGNISNKTSKKNGKYYNISSYRLTSVCSDKNIGNIDTIINEISKRDKTFDYYSILSRDEIKNNINYIWYIIPKNIDIFNPKKYIWKKMFGKRGEKKGKQTGWISNNLNNCQMKITFSMSSQLWIKIDISNIYQYQISKVNCNINDNTIDYIDLYDKLFI